MTACMSKALLAWRRGWVAGAAVAPSASLLTGPPTIQLMCPCVQPRSYLEKLADTWRYPRYLSAAAAASTPEERMKHVTAYFVAGEH